jgi:flagellar hook-associated protein 3 FlgL
MRITELTRFTTIQSARSHAAQRFDKASRVAANGTNVAAPSDDPALYAEKVKADHSLAMIDERTKLATSASNELAVADDALASAVDVMSKARSLAVEGANETLNADDRKVLAQNVSALRDQLIGLANTKYGDKYLFGGTATGAPPFDPNGNFTGNDGSIRVPVGAGMELTANVSGARAFTTTGGKDVFAELQKLATALSNNDVAGVSGSFTALDASHAQLVSAEMSAGTQAERFQSSVDVMTSAKLSIAQARQTIDGDPAEQLTNMEVARMTYERSIAVTRELLQTATLAGGTSG